MTKFIIPCLLSLMVSCAQSNNSVPHPSTASSPKTPITAATVPAGKTVKLPGLLIELGQGYVDVNAEVCLIEGDLEVIACTKGTKEHESIVVIEASAIHVHTALLLLGANSGNPAMKKAINEEKTQWIDLPPRGDPIDVSLVFPDIDGKSVERPIGDFITRSKDQMDEQFMNPKGAKQPEGDEEKFPGTFVFAGSALVDSEDGPRKYLADESGDVISISTFGDEVLCLPNIQSQENGALMWQVDATHLPKIHTKVILRLRPQKPLPKAVKP